MPQEQQQSVTTNDPRLTDARAPSPAGDQQNHPQEEPPRASSHWLRWTIIGVVGVLLLIGGLTFGRRRITDYLTTESTDDAYVNGHVSSISARVAGNVVRVHVDDNDRVTQGDVLVELDPEPYQVAVAQKQAALQVAEANLTAAMAQVRAQEALARSNWYSLLNAQEQVRYQIATLAANVADLKLQKANLVLAEREFARVRQLSVQRAAAREELDQRVADVEVAKQRVSSAEETIRRTRAELGLPPQAKDPMDVPKNLDQTFSAVQVALSKTAQALAQIGVPIKLYGLTPDELHKQLIDQDPSGDLNRTLDRFVQKAPAVLQARAARNQAREDLKNAELNLRYTRILAPIDGQVTRRSVNPGNNVSVSQALMAVRSLTEIWIDANFRENQIAEIRIGQPVEVKVDAYPGKTFRGRVEGFSAGTGSSLALIPPENATGNFVKIVQRLPVRITLDQKDLSDDTPLFIGLSTEPKVLIKQPPSGPNAGARLLATVKQRKHSREIPHSPSAPKSGPAEKLAPNPTSTEDHQP